jgi:transposase
VADQKRSIRHPRTKALRGWNRTRDYEAVAAAVEQHWSNGQVEGQVYLLKLLKRRVYGRGGFLLLRRRTLPFINAVSQRSP